MSKCCFTISLFSVLISTAIARSDNGGIISTELHPAFIDTLSENIMVIHKRYATIYFKQSDIQEYIKRQDKFGLPLSEKFIITNAVLKAKKKRIDFKDWYTEYTEEEKHLLRLIDLDGIDHMEMPEMWYIGYNLIKEGKFMILENKIRYIVYDGLKMINQNNGSGIDSVQFQLQEGVHFWQDLIIMGY
jgi:hypothetical protein